MASNGNTGFGLKLYYGTTAGTAGTAFAQIQDVSGPTESVNDVELTNNDSPDSCEEYIPGLTNGGEVSFDLVFNGSNHPQAIRGVSKVFTLVIPKSIATATQDTQVSWSGYVNNWGLEVPMKSAVLVKGVKIKVTGKVTMP
jgi:hypothetical protein